MTDAKRANLEFIRAKLPDLINDPMTKNKFVVVYGSDVRGAFDTFDAALLDAMRQFPPTDFVIQQALDEREVINFVRAAR